MIPDRFAQSAGGEFVESKGRERDHPFSDALVNATIEAYCSLFGFVPFGTIFGRLTDEITMYPRLVIHEEYFDGTTHDVSIETTGDVTTAAGGDFYANSTYTELAGAYKAITPGVPVTTTVTAQTDLTQTAEIGNIPGSPFCTTDFTISGDEIPIQDYLHSLYALHKREADFNNGSWQMVRDAVTHGLKLVHPGVGGDSSLAGRIQLSRGNSEVSGSSPFPPDHNLTIPAIAAVIQLFVSKTLMNVSSTGFSDWITKRIISPSSFSSERCLHATGVEVLQPAPIEDTDDWFDVPQLGTFTNDTTSIDLHRWAMPTIAPPAPRTAWVGTLPNCTA